MQNLRIPNELLDPPSCVTILCFNIYIYYIYIYIYYKYIIYIYICFGITLQSSIRFLHKGFIFHSEVFFEVFFAFVISEKTLRGLCLKVVKTKLMVYGRMNEYINR